jgi:hypothetical protein
MGVSHVSVRYALFISSRASVHWPVPKGLIVTIETASKFESCYRPEL